MNDAIKNLISSYLFNDEMKGKIVQALNDNIDVPLISEKTEAKIIDALYSSVEEVLKDAINKA